MVLAVLVSPGEPMSYGCPSGRDSAREASRRDSQATAKVMIRMRQSSSPRQLGYMPALDGVRAVGVLAVMAYHGGLSFLPGGFFALDTFFVLSGFLITTLLMREHQVDWGHRPQSVLGPQGEATAPGPLRRDHRGRPLRTLHRGAGFFPTCGSMRSRRCSTLRTGISLRATRTISSQQVRFHRCFPRGHLLSRSSSTSCGRSWSC